MCKKKKRNEKEKKKNWGEDKSSVISREGRQGSCDGDGANATKWKRKKKIIINKSVYASVNQIVVGTELNSIPKRRSI